MYRQSATRGQRYIPKQKAHEESLQLRVATYLKRNYPQVIFLSDAAGLFMTVPQAVKWKRMNSEHKRADIMILARSADGEYAGMALELKADHVSIYNKIGANKGAMTANPHIRAQAECHKLLREQGYYADFAVGYDDATSQIDSYFGAIQAELF
jgi:hypothetical protein